VKPGRDPAAGSRPQDALTRASLHARINVGLALGLAYHGAGIIRGTDLTKVLRYKPTS